MFRSTIHKLWQGSHGVTIKEVGNNLSLAIFTSEEDMMKVLDRSPWSFDRRLILMKQFNGDLSPGNVSFHYNKSELWWRNLSSQYVLILSPNTYGDEIVTKQHSSPKLRHRMYWWRKCFVTNKKNDRWWNFFVTNFCHQ